MNTTTVASIAMLVFAWAVVSGALSRRNVTGPMVFALAGYLLANPDWGVVTVDIETSTIHVVAEVTLALVLFSDAARVNLRDLRRDVSLPTRLLAVGLPLAVLLGGLLAAVLLLDLPWALAGFLGAALAPTDAALSVQVIEDERVPLRLRRALNVESGLNDGIVTPVVTLMLALAASQLGFVTESEAAGGALKELAFGVLVGLVMGAVGAALLSWSSRRKLIVQGGRRLAALALAVGTFAVALAVEGNGFIAAFVAGIAFGARLDTSVDDIETTDELPALGGELMALVVWFLFGAALLPVAFANMDGWVVVYALASLTVVRMLPVLVSLVGTGLDRPSALFVGWFGPRGLASVVFALLALEDLGETSALVNRAVAAVALTVLLSVVLHGASAGPGGRLLVERRPARGHGQQAA